MDRFLYDNGLCHERVDYACSVWYPKRFKRWKNEIQASDNKCIRVCLQLNKMVHISQKEFETINWLPFKKRFSFS